LDLPEKVKKNYVHPCSKCIYLGQYEDNFVVYDFYYCPKGSISAHPLKIARYGNKEGDELRSSEMKDNLFNEINKRVREYLNQ
jgi:hypothetical protein